MPIKEIVDEETGEVTVEDLGSEDELAALQRRLAELTAVKTAPSPQSATVTAAGPDDDGLDAQPGDPGPAPEPLGTVVSNAPVKRGPGRPPKDPHSLSSQAAVGGAVATAAARALVSTAGVPDDVAALMEQDAGDGLDFRSRDLIIPRLNLLQDNSPEVKEGTIGYVPGARPGLMMNTVTGQFAAKALFIPCAYSRRFVAWKPRNEKGGGGGLWRLDVPEAEFLGMEEIKMGKRAYIDPKAGPVTQGVAAPGPIEVVETPEWVGLISFDGGATFTNVAVAMAGSKAKVAAKTNALLLMQIAKRANGTEYTPACYAHLFRISTGREGEGADAYFNYVFDLMGRVQDGQLYLRAKAFKQQYKAGDVEVAPLAQSDAA